MHRGHIRLVEEAKARARQYGAKTAMFTFSNNHLAVLGREEKVLYTFDERLSLYESLGVDVVITTCFDANFMRTTGGEFVERLKRYDLKCVVCGFDYRSAKSIVRYLRNGNRRRGLRRRSESQYNAREVVTFAK